MINIFFFCLETFMDHLLVGVRYPRSGHPNLCQTIAILSNLISLKFSWNYHIEFELWKNAADSDAVAWSTYSHLQFDFEVHECGRGDCHKISLIFFPDILLLQTTCRHPNVRLSVFIQINSNLSEFCLMYACRKCRRFRSQSRTIYLKSTYADIAI